MLDTEAMKLKKQQPLILTLRPDAANQAFFDALRARYFPPERNYLKAHLTLFHHLAPVSATFCHLAALAHAPFQLEVTGLISLGAGVAYTLHAVELLNLRKTLVNLFKNDLIPQDLQGFRPHITIQNKVKPEQSRQLLSELRPDFKPFTVTAVGLDLWEYQGGPWLHYQTYQFV